jgi:hypothetical protein
MILNRVIPFRVMSGFLMTVRVLAMLRGAESVPLPNCPPNGLGPPRCDSTDRGGFIAGEEHADCTNSAGVATGGVGLLLATILRFVPVTCQGCGLFLAYVLWA